MLKDYFDSSLPVKDQQYVYEVLERIPLHCIFTSYSAARIYRAANCVKGENGRYDDVIFLYDSFYYLVSKDFFHRFKLFMAFLVNDVACKRDINFSVRDYHIDPASLFDLKE